MLIETVVCGIVSGSSSTAVRPATALAVRGTPRSRRFGSRSGATSDESSGILTIQAHERIKPPSPMSTVGVSRPMAASCDAVNGRWPDDR